uniref:Regulator of telomere elongation helicase 1 homolog n=1 Tax=Albugo laibachii Nc14 TaxID=890382 RepID=F0W0G8_9STRA|nr:conserved hypothetical protein [Albugo laibachii Nc14]|eukprot:CCA14540.1 conserved hypothetical protein [Albugo laibachii Nc14]
MLQHADIIFVPYNYLTDPIARTSLGISIENAILIFDEAHNVESVASDAFSYSFSCEDISACVSEIQHFVFAVETKRILLSSETQINIESAEMLKALLLEIGKALAEFSLSPSGGLTKRGEYIFEFFKRFNVTFKTCPLVISTIEEIIELTQRQGGEESSHRNSRLDMFMTFLNTVFRSEKEAQAISRHYRVHIQETKQRRANTPKLFNSFGNNTGKMTRVFNYWCFHPGLTFQDIRSKNVYNIILTSGTLSPLKTTIRELGIEFPIQLENKHVIDASQAWVGVLSKGVTGKRLNSSYNYRSTPEYLSELGNTIVNFVRATPNGILVFFPSYTILEDSISFWQKSPCTIWIRIAKLKEVFVEPRNRTEFNVIVDEYHQSIKVKQEGAVFFAVCRGRVSEGIDFANEKGRAVVITGLPFPPTKDPKIILKKGILDEATVAENETASCKLTGNQWYIQQASRAVNQAIGRVIRHRHDYGAIILCDERFGLSQQQKCLSKWLQPFCYGYKSYGDAHISLMRFFKYNSNHTNVRVSSSNSLCSTRDCESESNAAKQGSSPPLEATSPDKKHVDLNERLQSAHVDDGQFYVNPQLLHHAEGSTEDREVSSSRSKPNPRNFKEAQKTQMLASILSASRPITSSTSSVDRVFAPVKSANAVGNRDVKPNWTAERQCRASTLPISAVCIENANSSISLIERAQIQAFPTTVRQVLPSRSARKFFDLVKMLVPENEHLEEVFGTVCDMLCDPGHHKLLEMLPKVLNENIGQKFKAFVENVRSNDPSKRVADFFFRLESHPKRTKRQHVATIQNPQCSVCLDALNNHKNKAFASPCGHICCKVCWTKMERDGSVTCPMCKVPFQLDELRLLQASKAAERESTQSSRKTQALNLSDANAEERHLCDSGSSVIEPNVRGRLENS